MSDEGNFYHRPISFRVTSVRRMDDIRTLPPSETILITNQSFDKKSAREMILLLLPFVMSDESGIERVFITTEGLVP